MYKKYRNSNISKTKNFKKNVSNKTCTVSKELFIDFISLSDVKIKSKSSWFFFNGIPYFLFQNLIADVKCFFKIL